MAKLWNASTTVRNPKRILGFLGVCKYIDGKEWNNNTQCEYQIRLIQNKLYTPKIAHKNLYLPSMTYKQAEEVFYSKNYSIDDYGIRGRTSLNPLEKLRFVDTSSGFVKITNMGWALLNGTISYFDAMNLQMQQWKFTDEGANVKPFIAILHLIEGVNRLYNSTHGISKFEFGVFGMTINNYKNINNHINAIDPYRKGKIDSRNVLANYSNSYNFEDYLDNNVKYMKASTFLVINNRITFNYNLKATIDNILGNDDGRAY